LYITGALYFKNSFIIAASTMLLTLVLAIPAAYALSRFNFSGKSIFMLFLLVAQMLPAVLLVIPLFVLFKIFSLYNTYLSVILAMALVYPLRSSFRTSFLKAWKLGIDGAAFASSLVYRSARNEGQRLQLESSHS
jgi:multiple sugar transport system permease protein